MYTVGMNQIYGNQVNGKVFDVKNWKKSEKEGGVSSIEKMKKSEQEEEIQLSEKAAGNSQALKEDSIEISTEGRLAAEMVKEQLDLDVKEKEKELAGADTEEKAGENVSEEQGGKVGVNEGKRLRQIAAAQNQAQVQQVLALLQKDLSDCKAGLSKGWCDESEIAKVEALISKAKARMSQVPRESDEEQGGLDAFAMASLPM